MWCSPDAAAGTGRIHSRDDSRRSDAMKARPLKCDVAGTGDPIVLVPGGLTGWLSWTPHQERLAARHQAIRVQPIHNELGSAGEPGDPTYSRRIEQESLRLTLDEMGIERFHLAGWSAGGKTALDFAISAPERIRSLTLVEPAAYWILEEVGETDPELERFFDYLHSLAGKIITEDDLATFLSKAGFAEDPAAARRDPYWERALPHRMSLSWLSEDLMGSDHSVADLTRFEAPVLLTKGTKTEPWERRVVDLLGQYLPNARVADIEGTHAHHIESIDRFIDDLEAHLRISSAT
jgi:pimeloyl-ACP methyl ester carboxylesterase